MIMSIDAYFPIHSTYHVLIILISNLSQLMQEPNLFFCFMSFQFSYYVCGAWFTFQPLLRCLRRLDETMLDFYFFILSYDIILLYLKSLIYFTMNMHSKWLVQGLSWFYAPRYTQGIRWVVTNLVFKAQFLERSQDCHTPSYHLDTDTG